MIWDPTSDEGDKENNYLFVILLIHTLTQYKYIIINSLSGNKLLVMSTIWPGIFFLWLLFKYKIKHKMANKGSNNSYKADQGKNTIKLPKSAYNSFSKVWKQLNWNPYLCHNINIKWKKNSDQTNKKGHKSTI